MTAVLLQLLILVLICVLIFYVISIMPIDQKWKNVVVIIVCIIIVIVLVSWLVSWPAFAQEPPKPPPPPTPDTAVVEPLPTPEPEVSDKPNYFYGKVSSVSDGDTFTLLVAQGNPSREPLPQRIKVRMAGIDAPESKQKYGSEAEELLSWMIDQKPVIVLWKEKDRYGRYICLVYPHFKHETIDGLLDFNSVNASMVESGFAWHYTAYDKSAVLTQKEEQARSHHLGLWADETPEAPWEFRKRMKAVNSKQGESDGP